MKKDENMNKKWHWHPDLPVALSPIMDWPPRPLLWIKWLAGYWLAIGSITIEFAMAWVIFMWFLPDAETMRVMSFDWIGMLWIRNALLLTLAAGGLHWWFYMVKGQGKKLKFDPRDLTRGNRKFWFKDQVKDNIFWSIASGVTIWTIFEAIYFWAASNGYVWGLEWRTNPVWFAAFFVIIPIWSSMHFYFIHRLLHWPPLYRLAHSLHHRNVNIGPWSGIAMHPIEHVLYFSSVMIHFVVPSHPVHVLFHFYQEGINPSFSHSGYAGVLLGEKNRIVTGNFFHQLHHRHITYNYGTVEMPWDRLFGTFHDGNGVASKR